jgi:hypothetical protein
MSSRSSSAARSPERQGRPRSGGALEDFLFLGEVAGRAAEAGLELTDGGGEGLAARYQRQQLAVEGAELAAGRFRSSGLGIVEYRSERA